MTRITLSTIITTSTKTWVLNASMLTPRVINLTVTLTQFLTTVLKQVITSTTEVTKTVTEFVTLTITPWATETTTPTEEGLEVVQAELVSPHIIYYTSAKEIPGRVYVYNYQFDALGHLFQRTEGGISSFTFHPYIHEKVYYLDSNTNEIRLFLLGSGDYGVVFEHETYVRCIRFGPGDRPYFSEATGAGGNGKIYKIVENRAELYYEVRLEDVNGFWAGNFEFDDDGNLYLSSGNRIPASIYKVVHGVPRKIETFNFPVCGIRYVRGITLRAGGDEAHVDRGLLLADWGSSIYLYDLDSGTLYKIYENPDLDWLSDVSIA